MNHTTVSSPLSLTPIDWLDWSTRFLFFTGKGGVGKTTIASTVALRLAESGRTVLLVSTDPASNLDDVFEMQAGSQASPVPSVPTLSLMNLDPEAAASAYRERVIGPSRTFLPASVLRTMEEQLSGACTVEIAAFNEFTHILADQHLLTQFDHIVFDTAPTGHTLRLLSLPSAWRSYIATNRHGASCLGPLAGLDAQREQYQATVQVLSDREQTTLVLVSRLEKSPLQEAARASTKLAALGITHQKLVLNGLFLQEEAGQDSIAHALLKRQHTAFQTMPKALQKLSTSLVPLVASHLTGLSALRALAGSDSPAPNLRRAPEQSIPLPSLADLAKQILTNDHGVILLMGKGGVGKTTLAAALAVRLAQAGYPVHLSTTDPAAHLEQTLGTTLPAGMTLHRIDPVREVQRYTQEMMEAASPLDEEGRALLEEDLRSPCTEEIAVFRAFARTVQAAAEGFVVLDTAPTGHTLLLLDAAESYHREVARATGQVPPEVRSLLPRLRDPHYTTVLLVTLAESTPIQEAERLQADLRRAAIEPFGWIINASYASSGTTHPLLTQRAVLEIPHIQRVTQELASRTWLLPWYAHTNPRSVIQ